MLPAQGKGSPPVRKSILRSSQVPGTPGQGASHSLQRRPWLPYPAGCTRKLVLEGLGRSREGGETASLVSLAPQLLLGPKAVHRGTYVSVAAWTVWRAGQWGRGGCQALRYSGALRAPPAGCLSALPQAQQSQGLRVNQAGHEQTAFLDEVFLQMKIGECHQVCPLSPSVFTG